MQSPDDRSRTTFGKRRTVETAPSAQAGSQVGSAGRLDCRAGRARQAEPDSGPLPWALRVAGLAGIVAVIGAYQLPRG